jgi:hypothetical protein
MPLRRPVARWSTPPRTSCHNATKQAKLDTRDARGAKEIKELKEKIAELKQELEQHQQRSAIEAGTLRVEMATLRKSPAEPQTIVIHGTN